MIKKRRLVKLGARGFTLIEVIASLTLLGLIALMAGLGIVQVTKQYVFAQKAGETAQVAQVAMARMVKELTMLRSCTSSSVTSINYDIPTLPGRSISWSANSGEILVNGQKLVEHIQSFSLSYYNSYNDPSPAGSYQTGTTMIGITFGMTGAEGIVSTFTSRAFPRN